MHFIARCLDKADAGSLRADTRPAHLDWMAAQLDAISIAGPLLDEKDAPLGSLLIVEGLDREAVAALLAEDPYAKAGLFASVEITPWKWVVGRPED
jgi:uncharacterized protein